MLPGGAVESRGLTPSGTGVPDLLGSPYYELPTRVKFSPDGSLRCLPAGAGENASLAYWRPRRGESFSTFRSRWSGDTSARFLSRNSRQTDVISCSCAPSLMPRGHKTVLPRAYDTKTWEKRDRPPGLPENSLTCVESPKGKRAVVLLNDDVVALWDAERHRLYATLDKNVQIREAAFSPDESMVAMATVNPQKGGPWRLRTRVWKVDSGRSVHPDGDEGVLRHQRLERQERPPARKSG